MRKGSGGAIDRELKGKTPSDSIKSQIIDNRKCLLMVNLVYYTYGVIYGFLIMKAPPFFAAKFKRAP